MTHSPCAAGDHKMLIFSHAQLCDLLYKSFNPSDVIGINSQGSGNCNPVDVQNYLQTVSTTFTSRTLIGYYIVPYGGRWEHPVDFDRPDNDYVHSVFFHPVWLVEHANGFQELVENGIRIVHGYNNYTDHEDDNCSADIYASVNNSSTHLFNHNELQYDKLTNYGKSFISRHALFMLFQFSKYVGFTGAKVSSGNFRLRKDSYSGDYVLNAAQCNTDYFTYKFVGFDKIECVECDINGEPAPPNQARLSNSGGDSSNMPSFMTETPGVVWATPCPPTWRPQP